MVYKMVVLMLAEWAAWMDAMMVDEMDDSRVGEWAALTVG